jgi:hypothetical protein
MKVLNEELPKIFRENGAPEIIVENIRIRLNVLSDEMSKQTNASASVLTEEGKCLICGFIDGVCLMLLSGNFINTEQYKNIMTTWEERCHSFNIH